MKIANMPLIACLCLVLTLVGSGCASNKPLVLQFSPDKDLKSYRQNQLLGDMRLASMEPPGKPAEEIATLSSNGNGLRITLIQSADGTILYERPSYYSFIGAMSQRSFMGIRPGMICQLPAGTYKIGAALYAGSAYQSEHDVYLTEDLQNGHSYYLTYSTTKTGKWKLIFQER